MESERVKLKKGYKPKKSEKYMGPQQQEYFRQKLENWRADLIEESRETINHLQHEVRDVGDEAERATRETENSLELRTRDRYRKLIRKIDKALIRLDDGEYGYARLQRCASMPRSDGNCGKSSREMVVRASRDPRG